MSIIELQFEFSVKTEIKRVENTLAKLDWYRNNGYNPDLPNDLNNIEKSVENEFGEKLFQQVQNGITNEWKKVSADFPSKLKTLKLDCHNIYRIQLTKYGVRGSYNLPNVIIINIRDREIKDIVRTVIHEIIHLSIENWIIEYKTPHWQKERLVDLIFDKIYQELNKMREPKENSDTVDRNFKKYYPDIKKVIKNIGTD